MERQIISFLWTLLDDIDTASDIAKSDDKMYKRLVERIQKRRWECGITTNGQTLDLTSMKVPTKPVEQ